MGLQRWSAFTRCCGCGWFCWHEKYIRQKTDTSEESFYLPTWLRDSKARPHPTRQMTSFWLHSSNVYPRMYIIHYRVLCTQSQFRFVDVANTQRRPGTRPTLLSTLFCCHVMSCLIATGLVTSWHGEGKGQREKETSCSRTKIVEQTGCRRRYGIQKLFQGLWRGILEPNIFFFISLRFAAIVTLILGCVFVVWAIGAEKHGPPSQNLD